MSMDYDSRMYLVWKDYFRAKTFRRTKNNEDFGSVQKLNKGKTSIENLIPADYP